MALISPTAPRNILFLKKPDSGFRGESRGTRHAVRWKSTIPVLISAMIDSKAVSEGAWAKQWEIKTWFMCRVTQGRLSPIGGGSQGWELDSGEWGARIKTWRRDWLSQAGFQGLASDLGLRECLWSWVGQSTRIENLDPLYWAGPGLGSKGCWGQARLFSKPVLARLVMGNPTGLEHNVESRKCINWKPHQMGPRGSSRDCWCRLPLSPSPWELRWAKAAAVVPAGQIWRGRNRGKKADKIHGSLLLWLLEECTKDIWGSGGSEDIFPLCSCCAYLWKTPCWPRHPADFFLLVLITLKSRGLVQLERYCVNAILTQKCSLRLPYFYMS